MRSPPVTEHGSGRQRDASRPHCLWAPLDIYLPAGYAPAGSRLRSCRMASCLRLQPHFSPACPGPDHRPNFASGRTWWKGGRSTSHGNLGVRATSPWPPPHRRPGYGPEWVHRNGSAAIPPVVRTVRSPVSVRVGGLVLIDSVIQGFWLNELNHRVSVLRVGDRMGGFSQFTEEMLRLQAELIRMVDLVVIQQGVSATTWLDPCQARAVLPNGVDFAHFNHHDLPAPTDLAGFPVRSQCMRARSMNR